MKNYMKPVASVVAFVVNENIAASITESVESFVYFANNNGMKDCNTYINGSSVPTGLPAGVFDLDLAMDNIDAAMKRGEIPADALDDMLSMLNDFRANPSEFTCA